MKTIKSIVKWLFIVIGSSAIVLIFLAWLIGADHRSGTSAPPATQTAVTTPPIAAPQTNAAIVPMAAPTKPPTAIPAIEAQFITIMDSGAHRYSAGANDMAKGAARPARAREICALLKSPTVTGWRGTVTKLSSNGDGKGVLEVQISPIAYLKTWNNALSDTSDQTLIEPTSALFQEATALSEGQHVVFSGVFRPSQVDCVEEPSMTIEGSMTEPEFIFRFTSIAPAD